MQQEKIDDFRALESKHGDETTHEYIVKLRTYIASVLTGLSEEEEKILFKRQDLIIEICEENNIEVHAPKNVTHPLKHKHILPEDVWSLDLEKVLQSDFIVVMADKPSFGVGIEVEETVNALIPIILLRPLGQSISRMLLGIPSMKYEVEVDENNLKDEFLKALELIRPKVVDRKKWVQRLGRSPIGRNIMELRENYEGKDSLDSFADKVGISTKELTFIEEKPIYLSNPSIIVLMRMADLLNVSLAELVDPYYVELSSKEMAETLSSMSLHEIEARRSGQNMPSKGIPNEDYKRILKRKLYELASRL
ncbi:MAG: helix-turn-helix transcriptional regulator [Euryarchaeota archaeon]|nr:helix-turn-helix transcriptional regulator [Euryarchaeota archaeon]